jgi:hypothetical protein
LAHSNDASIGGGKHLRVGAPVRRDCGQFGRGTPGRSARRTADRIDDDVLIESRAVDLKR